MDCKLSVVRVFVRDWDRAVRFYTETLGLPVAFRSDEIGWCQLDTGEANLALEREAPDAEESYAGRFVGASLAVDDVEKTWRELVGRGVEFEGEPAKMPWGGTLAHLRDPDGNVITLVGNTR